MNVLPQLNTYFFDISPLEKVVHGITRAGKPYASFRATVISQKRRMERTVTVFATLRNPGLVDEIVAMRGVGRFIVAFDKTGEGETLRIVGISRKAANDHRELPNAA